METIFETLQKYKEDIESKGHTVYAIMLKGSQNYNLADKDSDIDANAILIPSLSELRTNRTYKYTYPAGEVTCHNIYSFAEIVAKGNPQWIEVCHTEYHIGGNLDMFKNFTINPSALKGMLMEKVHAFDKLYPSRAKYVKQFGYDPKQLHHIIRLYDSLLHDDPIYRYESLEREHMLDIKRGRYPKTKEYAFKIRDTYVSKLEKIYEERKLQYKKQPIDYNILDKIVMQHYISQYNKQNNKLNQQTKRKTQ